MKNNTLSNIYSLKKEKTNRQQTMQFQQVTPVINPALVHEYLIPVSYTLAESTKLVNELRDKRFPICKIDVVRRERINHYKITLSHEEAIYSPNGKVIGQYTDSECSREINGTVPVIIKYHSGVTTDEVYYPLVRQMMQKSRETADLPIVRL
jgi:hypothetical protein